MSLPVVAIVGRPNVGKSTLFNRLLRRRKAIVESEAGVTRDRLYAEAEWAGRSFLLVDTGGLDWDEETTIQIETTRQAEVAIAEGDVVVFVVDALTGATPADEAVAEVLRRARKPILLAVNKVDDPSRESLTADFYRLSVGTPLAVSAYHGTGTGDLLDEILKVLPPGREPKAEGDPGSGADDPAGPVAIAVVGRPNVGKSSLVNALIGEERMIVSDVPGTTRDAIDIPLRHKNGDYVLIDTAGLRRRARVAGSVEKYSILRSLRAISRSDAVVLLLDATRPIAEQDKRVAGYVIEAGRALVLVVNKWDLVDKDDWTYLTYEKILRSELHFADWAPVVFVSAVTGHNLTRLMTLTGAAARNHRKRVPTPEVNQVFRDAVAVAPPPAERGRRLKVSYVTQAETAPPTFVFFVNSPDLADDGYRRYLEGRARQAWDFTGTPLRLRFRPKGS